MVRGAIVFIAEKRLRNHQHTAPVNRVVPYLFEYFCGSVSCGGDEQKLIATQPTLQDLPLGDESDFCIQVAAGIVSLFKFSEVGRRLPRQHLGRELERGGLRIEYGNFRGNIDEGSYFLVQPAQIERGSNQVTDICQWIGPTVSEGRVIDAVNFTRGLRRPMKELRYRFAV